MRAGPEGQIRDGREADALEMTVFMAASCDVALTVGRTNRGQASA
jgi:hypothetical protein